MTPGGCDDNEVCPDTHDPVCGSDDVTHWNECELKSKACDFPELDIRVKHHGPCQGWFPGACIIKLIAAVIYGFHNKLECVSLNTRLGWKGLPGTNTLAYYGNRNRNTFYDTGSRSMNTDKINSVS
jgi:hypothetical protein